MLKNKDRASHIYQAIPDCPDGPTILLWISFVTGEKLGGQKWVSWRHEHRGSHLSVHINIGGRDGGSWGNLDSWTSWTGEVQLGYRHLTLTSDLQTHITTHVLMVKWGGGKKDCDIRKFEETVTGRSLNLEKNINLYISRTPEPQPDIAWILMEMGESASGSQETVHHFWGNATPKGCTLLQKGPGKLTQAMIANHYVAIRL